MKKQPLIVFFVSAMVVLAAVLAGATAEPQWYTLQIGSYESEEDALLLYNTLRGHLLAADQDELRIEEIPPYFTVRMGKFAKKTDAETLEEYLRPYHYRTTIVQAYIRAERIRQRVGTAASPKSVAASPPEESPKAAEPLYYTIQLNTFPAEKEAGKLFAQLGEKLPPPMRAALRIEKISSTYAVRIGQAQTRQDLRELFNEVQKIVATPLIMQAYIRPARVVKAYAQATPPPAQPLQTESRPVAERLDDTPASTPRKELPAALPAEPPPPPIAAATPPPASEPLATASTPAQGKPTGPDKPTGPIPGSLEYQERILAKYLHTSQAGREKEKNAAKSKADRTPATPTCVAGDCHPGLGERNPGHYPAKTMRCTTCHMVPPGATVAAGHGKFPLAAQGAALCALCHAEVAKGKVIHPPTAEGNCLHCHNPHGTDNPALLAMGQTGQQKLCLECHEGKIMAAKFQHGPVGLGVCTYCHNPHSAEEKGLLRESQENLCLSCHADFRKNLAESPVIHTPLKKQGCLTCHSPHGSQFPHLLAEAGQNFCFTCHRELETKIDKARSKHAALGLDKQCDTCHLPHFSEEKSLLRKNEKALCFTCHGNNVSMPPYKPGNVEKQIEGKEYIHAPVAAGECSTCHSPHGSPNLKLLIGKYPASFYAPYEAEEYALCFICHPTELLSAVETTSKTAFRNGSKNLHFTHVGMERKGRTCQACHAVHASDGPKLINRTGAPFGSWTMSVDYFVTKNGGSCTPSCHRDMTYDREKPIDYKKTETGFGKYYIDYKSLK